MNRAVLTVALGRPVYVEMACTLARSFKLWHRDSDVQFVLATDRPDLVPHDLRDVVVREVDVSEYGHGFASKLRLDLLTPANRTLFIDADCLVVGNLEPVFEHFRGHAVSAVGDVVGDGEWFGDLRRRCADAGVDGVPRFVGALYYFERGAMASHVFATAREMEPHYDALGMVRLRGMPNEEPLLSLAMARHGQTPVRDDGSIKADAMHFPDEMRIDVVSGRALFRNTTGRRVTTSPAITEARPLVAHFNASFAERLPYTREALRLKRIAQGWPRPLADLNALVTRTLPQHFVETVKIVLRPAYRRIFGARAVRSSPRVADGPGGAT